MEKTNVLILAGGTLPEDLEKYSAGFNNRALLKIGDKYMIEYVVDALRGSELIGEILVVGIKSTLEKEIGRKVDYILEAKETMLENIQIGLDHFDGTERLIISSCDVPLLKTEMVERFIEACNNYPGEIYYPIVEKTFNEQKYPETKRTYFRLRDGVFTGGNLVIVNPSVFKKNWHLLEKAIGARKSPLKLLGMIGIGFIFRYIFGILTLEALENKIQSIVGMSGKAIQVVDPEIGIDVDKESDYLLVKQHLD